jgi:hypothetical protein
MTQGNLSYLLDEVVTGVIMDSAFFGEPLTPTLYSMRPMTGRRERITSVGSLSSFAVKPETVAATEDEITQQYQTTFTAVSYAKALVFSRELVEFEEWGTIARMGTEIGNAYMQTIEDYGSALFNDAVSGATYTAEDGSSICNNAHTNVDGLNSQDNYQASTALGMAGIKTCRDAMRAITNYEGTAFSKLKPDLLLLPLELEETGWEIVNSLGRPDSTNRVSNLYSGKFKLLVWDELTSATLWFMIDSAKMAQNLLWLWSSTLETFGDGDLFTGTRKMGGYFRAIHGCVDWRWVMGAAA